MKKWVLVLVVVLLAVSIGASKKEAVIKLNGGTMTISQLADVLPGASTIMVEVGNRFTTASFAAKAGNWDIVEYELEELEGIMSVLEITRPKRKKAISKFLDGSAYKKLQDSVKAKNAAGFQAAFNETVVACNKCHTSSGKPFIQYAVPSVYSGNLKLAP